MYDEIFECRDLPYQVVSHNFNQNCRFELSQFSPLALSVSSLKNEHTKKNREREKNAKNSNKTYLSMKRVSAGNGKWYMGSLIMLD